MTSSTNGSQKARAQKSWCVHPTKKKKRSPYPGSLIKKGVPPQLVNKDTNEPPVAQSHSRIRGGFFRKRRDMSLEISAPVSQAVDVVLLTFILVWRERLAGKIKPTGDFPDMIPLSPLPVDV